MPLLEERSAPGREALSYGWRVGNAFYATPFEAATAPKKAPAYKQSERGPRNREGLQPPYSRRIISPRRRLAQPRQPLRLLKAAASPRTKINA